MNSFYKTLFIRLLNKVSRHKILGTRTSLIRPNPFSHLDIGRKLEYSHFWNNDKLTNKQLEALPNDNQHCYLIFSIVPLEDSGGGQRSTQLAKWLSRLNSTNVVLINAFPSYDTSNTIQVFFKNPNVISLVPLELLSEKVLIHHLEKYKKVTVLCEGPIECFLTLSERIKSSIPKAEIILEAIDLWGGQLGSSWYLAEVEKKFNDFADHLTASSIYLQKRSSLLSGREVTYIPNAVDSELFRYHDTSLAKSDTAIYVGALWGDWIDFCLFEEFVSQNAEWNLLLVGKPSEKAINLSRKYENVSLSGLVQNKDIPNLIAASQFCFAPFTQTQLSAAVSPVKVFEYLSIGRPVITSGLPELNDFPGVFHLEKTKTLATAMDLCGKAMGEMEQISKKIRSEESWEKRVENIARTNQD